ncbi:unnamed protein product [Paramecium octaurelia]|uniref:Viral A-type inclusion protein n=1 Tax=Paramecium octaurelia TaxID=43137 RepID=A0A8S1UX90_PAROT|nr:unnamed protein product [Paramecium octaurelia]
MILIFIYIGLVITKELGALLETVKNNEYSMSILKQMKQYLNEKKSPYEILVYINEEEDKLVSEIIDDMNNYQQEQLISSQKKQELKYQMMLTKFTSALQADELLLLSNEAKLSEDIRMQRVDLLLELGQVIPQLEQLLKDELTAFDLENSELALFLESFNEFIPSSPQKLNGQKQHLKENPEAILKEFITTNTDDSPFNLLISQIQQSQGNGNISDAVSKSRDLVNEIQKSLQSTIKSKKDLIENVKQSLTQDNEQWKLDIASIEPIAKITKEKLNQLQKQKDELQVMLKHQQTEFNELQENIDNNYTSYSSKRLQDMNNLNIIRMIKQFYSEHLDVLEDFMKSKMQ